LNAYLNAKAEPVTPKRLDLSTRCSDLVAILPLVASRRYVIVGDFLQLFVVPFETHGVAS
jgi:hypothetical protein